LKPRTRSRATGCGGSRTSAKLLDAFGGVRSDRDILQFGPAHCHRVPGYLRIVDTLVRRGWRRDAFWPHGGHLFTLAKAQDGG
jgi:hypothetical protein